MRTVTVLVALVIMVKLSAQETENSLFTPAPASPDKVLVIFTYYRQFLPDLESVTFLSDGRVQSATFFNGVKQGSLRSLKSHVESAAELLFRFIFNKRAITDINQKEIIIPVKLADGRSLYLFPEHRLIINYTGSAHTFPRIKPILITQSKLSLWLKISLRGNEITDEYS